MNNDIFLSVFLVDFIGRDQPFLLHNTKNIFFNFRVLTLNILINTHIRISNASKHISNRIS